MAEYNVPHGSKNPGMAVVRSYRYLAGDQCSSENVRLAMILGWCVEWVSYDDLLTSLMKIVTGVAKNFS